MKHVTGRTYRPGHKWSRADLKKVTPDKIVVLVKQEVYGDADADPDEAPPVHHRANTILYWKKAWSYFMLDQGTPWSDVAKIGNPTKAQSVNRVIRAMKKMEAARRGKPSQARRALRPVEFEAIVESLQKARNLTVQIGVWLTAYLTFMYNMIARVDDTAKWRAPDLNPFSRFPDYGITAVLCWTKNCMEERDPPTQVLFGSRDWRYCVLCHLAVWLEHHFQANPEENEFFFGVHGYDAPEDIKGHASYHLRKLTASENIDVDFDEVDGKTGMHSIRKFAVNKCRGQGMTKDAVDHRGRWKSADRQQDTYADTTIPYVDACAAASLCTGGAIAYLVRPESGITDEWILQHVVPHIVAARVPRQACVVLGRALLWKVAERALDGESPHLVPAEIVERVSEAYRDLGERNKLPVHENPVRRANLGVSGVDAELHVFEVLGGDDEGGAGGGATGDGRHQRGVRDAEVRFLASEVARCRRTVENAEEEGTRRSIKLEDRMRSIEKSMKRIALQPGRKVAPAARQEEDGEAVVRPALVADLSKRPKFLHDLWKEWIVGSTGKKAAKDFTSAERGAHKSIYSLRKVFWEKIAELVRAGMTADRACDLVYEAYGLSLSVTEILRKMRTDRKRNTWPEQIRVRRY